MVLTYESETDFDNLLTWNYKDHTSNHESLYNNRPIQGVEDSSVVEPAPRDTQVLRGCDFKSHWVLLLGPCATGVLRPA